MIYKAFHDKIVALLPSADLRAAVRVQKHVFCDKDLLRFIREYAPTWAKKTELFMTAANVFTDKETVYHAKKLAEHCKKIYEYMTAPDADAVYILEVSYFPYDEKPDQLAARTFADAVSAAKAHRRKFRKYDTEGESDRFAIKKLSLREVRTAGDLNKSGELCSCGWDCKAGITWMYTWRLKNEFGVDCVSCNKKHECIQSHDIKYPAFLQPHDLVAFRSEKFAPTTFDEYGNPDKYADTVYGVMCSDMRSENDNKIPFVIGLNNHFIRTRTADAKTADGEPLVLFDHEHPSYAELYKPNISELPKGVYDDYLYAVDALKNCDISDKDARAFAHPPQYEPED